MTILLIDDDRDDRELFQEAVKAVDPSIHCILIGSAVEGLDLLTAGLIKPDRIFLDINMPLMDGRECLLELKKDPTFRNIPIVMYSTSNDANEITRFKQLGADYLNKPNSFETLKKSLAHYLKLICNAV